MKTTEEYYSTLYKGVQGKWVVLSTFKPDTNVGVLVENLPAEIAARSSEADQSLFATFAVFDKRPLTGRGKGADIGAIVAFFADMDVSDGGHYADNKNPPMTLAELKSAVLGWGLPSPSAIVNSGRGYHFEWRLDKPFIITSQTERTRANLALKGFNSYVIEKAAEAGIKLDSMGDLARVKRAPGSVNHRPGQPARPVEVVELEPDRTYSIEFMEGFKPSVSRHRESQAVLSESGPSWDQVVANDPFIKHCIANAKTITYGEWFAGISIAARCGNGREHAHEFSQLDPARYNARTTDEKIDETLKVGGAVTYAYIREELGFKGLDEDELASRLHSPLDFGKMPQAEIHVLRTTVYDLGSDRFFDIPTMTTRTNAAFAMQHGHRVASPLTMFRSSPLSIKAVKADYLPGLPRLVGTGERVTLNTWQESQLKPVEGECPTILAHFDYLIPNEAERNHVLDYFAHLVQRPGQKIRHALFIAGGQGTGKNLAVSWLERIIGEPNHRLLGADALPSRFKADRIDKSFITVDEVAGIDHQTANDMKGWITGEYMPVEEKGVPRFQGRTPRGWVFLSNMIDGLKLDDDDRRYAIIQAARTKQSGAYYDDLISKSESELPAFAYYLGKRPLDGFEPNRLTLDSPIKGLIAQLSLSPFELGLRQAMDGEEGVFVRDFGTAEAVVKTVVSGGYAYNPPTPARVGIILSKENAISLDQMRIPGVGKKRLWVWRNHEKWASASPQELADEVRRTKPLIEGAMLRETV